MCLVLIGYSSTDLGLLEMLRTPAKNRALFMSISSAQHCGGDAVLTYLRKNQTTAGISRFVRINLCPRTFKGDLSVHVSSNTPLKRCPSPFRVRTLVSSHGTYWLLMATDHEGKSFSL